MALGFSLADLDAAADTVHEVVPQTPQYAFPLRCKT